MPTQSEPSFNESTSDEKEGGNPLKNNLYFCSWAVSYFHDTFKTEIFCVACTVGWGTKSHKRPLRKRVDLFCFDIREIAHNQMPDHFQFLLHLTF